MGSTKGSGGKEGYRGWAWALGGHIFLLMVFLFHGRFVVEEG